MSRVERQWETKQKILVILAHPDDPEFFCGGSIAKWTEEGHEVEYCLLTRGDKGAPDRKLSPEQLCAVREIEQRQAAALLGVHSVRFLNHKDGELFPSLEIREEIIREIRRAKPNIVVTCDPTNLFPDNSRINHPDHRAAGQIVVDAFFPGVGNPMFFPNLMDKEGLLPWKVNELWLSLTGTPTLSVDVSDYWDRKIQAILAHRSQIPDVKQLVERMRSRRTADSTEENPRYEERFRRFLFV